MFGLKWGQSPDQIRQMGIALTKESSRNNLHMYKTDSLPKNLSLSESYVLIFAGDTALVKITMASRTIAEDPYGTEGKSKFDNLQKLLKQNYTMGKSFCSVGHKLYEDSDEFYECLAYKGCGMWTIFFSSDNKTIMLEIEGIKRGTGFIKMSVEASPEFTEAVKEYKALETSSDADALQ
ncbi:MAG: hypothetical protein JW963_04415 [Anaerolineales bacterium]|nr:hypothetical protein [Anaerolineales bacterium]